MFRSSVFGRGAEVPDFKNRRGGAVAASFGAPSCSPETHLDIPDNVLILGYATIADGVANFVQRDEVGPPGVVCMPQLPPLAISISTTQ